MQYKIVVSGAAKTEHCCKNIQEICREVGREIARHKCVLITGGTTGVPYFVALGFKEIGGISIGFSPAVSESAHIKTYKLPIDAFDVMVYTGSDYAGRNMIMTKSGDGVIVICGRMGTLHEFATAFEIKKPIGVMESTGGTADKIRQLIMGPYRGYKRVFYETEPKAMVERMIKQIKKQK